MRDRIKSAKKTAPRKIHFVSLGCAKNRVDTEVMAGIVAKAGIEITPEPESADAIVVNTCGFILPAKEESIETILEMAKFKKSQPRKKLVVAGCLPQRYKQELVDSLPEVDYFLGNANFIEILKALNGAGGKKYAFPDPEEFAYDSNLPRVNSLTPFSAYLKISEGCSRKCSFCTIPAIRGRGRSRRVADILREAENLARLGVMELNLIAQDLTAYGRDLTPKLSLYDLLKELDGVESIRWIRLLYTYPQYFERRLLNLIAESEKILPYIDIPIQHIDDDILKMMKRGTSEAKIRKLIGDLRKTIPGVTLRTSLIVGFPGETEEKFEKLLRFVEEMRFERLGVFKYSPEEDTPAALMKNQIPDGIKTARYKKIMRAQKNVSREINRSLLETHIEVLAEAFSDDSGFVLEGRAKSQAPEVDGICYIADGFSKPGKILKCKVVDFSDYDLIVKVDRDSSQP
ncbi:MAG: 30S ribosomal protein S12 methylthiotransferase RimO [Myxococcota bacterium]